MEVPSKFYQYVLMYRTIKPDARYMGLLGSYNTFGEAYDSMVSFFSMDAPSYKMYISESNKTQDETVYYDVSIFSIRDYQLLKQSEVKIERVLLSLKENDIFVIPEE